MRHRISFKSIDFYIKSHSYVKVVVENNSIATQYTGFLISYGKKYLTMCQIYDFHYEGYLIISLNDIFEISSLEYYKFVEYVCQEENLFDFKYPIFLNEPDDLSNILSNFLSCDTVFSIETRGQISAFFLGKLIKVSEAEFEFLDVGMDGVWDTETHIIQMSSVSIIAFDDKYSKMYNKYSHSI